MAAKYALVGYDEFVGKKKVSDEKFISELPCSYRAKANRMVQHINENPGSFVWNDCNELEFEGKILRNTNRHTLVRYFIQKHGIQPPTGSYEFASLLLSSNIPVTATGPNFKQQLPSYGQQPRYKNLDGKIQEIIQDSTLTMDAKLKQYSQALNL